MVAAGKKVFKPPIKAVKERYYRNFRGKTSDDDGGPDPLDCR